MQTHGYRQTHKQTTQNNRYQPIPPQGTSDRYWPTKTMKTRQK